ncbi:MAG TPA: hypothetical protein VFT43_02680, partial [Candidatus Polarisedimenticolia bacterium]|nr:hypothetical protein [Candidatus Polarisedimenticolia bacterium]
ATGVPWAVNDPFNYWTSGGNNLVSWATAHDTQQLEDPWLRFVAGGPITSAPNTNPQPWPFAGLPGDEQRDHSNLFQNTVINCPTFSYSLWKSIAQSGNKNNYYYAYDSGSTNFRLDGTGPLQSFQQATDGKSGVFFFDTDDGTQPRGLYTDTSPTTNLTPAINIAANSGWQGVSGFVFLNAKQFATTGAGTLGGLQWIVPPGEPGDSSTNYVNLRYPSGAGTVLTDPVTISQTTTRFQNIQTYPPNGEWYCTDALNGVCGAGAVTNGAPRKDDYGAPFQDTVVLNGVLYISGVFSVQGNANYYGSLVAQQGVLDGAGTPGFYFDERLIKNAWPPKGLNIPRVIVTAWQTDL